MHNIKKTIERGTLRRHKQISQTISQSRKKSRRLKVPKEFERDRHFMFVRYFTKMFLAEAETRSLGCWAPAKPINLCTKK